MRGFILVVPVSTRKTASIIPVDSQLHAQEFQLHKCVPSAIVHTELHTSGAPQMGFNARAFHLAKALQCYAFGKQYACYTVVVTGKDRMPLTLKEAQMLQHYANQKHWKQ